MRKHLGFKASVLLVVIFFHSFVLIPIANASAMSAVATAAVRWGYAAVAPSVVNAAAVTGSALLLEVAIYAGIGYLLFSPSALTKMKSWWNSTKGASTPDLQHAGARTNCSDGYYFIADNPSPDHVPRGSAYNPSNQQIAYLANADSINAFLAAHGGVPGTPAPTTPTDYGATPIGTDPGFVPGDFSGTPGIGGALQSPVLPPILKATFIPPDQVEGYKGALGLGSIDPATGAQPNGTHPPTDNTVTQGQSDTNGILSLMTAVLVDIKNYVSNLVGIKTDTGHIAASMDNVVGATNAQTQAINNQTAIDNQILGKMDNVAKGVENLNKTLSTQSNLSVRLDELSNLMATKFPFSFVMAVEKPDGDYAGTYTIPNIVMPMGHEIVVDPMQNVQIAAMITFVRGLVAIGMWACFIIYLVRKVVEL